MPDERPRPYEGNVCPECGKIAYAGKGGHDSECSQRKGVPGQEDT
jgi:hypothetical protein